MEKEKDKRTDTAGGKKPRSSDADRREALRKKQQAEQFKRRYFELYDDVKISYKEDW